MARRGVLVLLGCAWTLTLAEAAGGGELASSPVLLAQLRAPIVAQAAGGLQQPALISLDFKDADINNILRILADFSGLNIVTSNDVKGNVTVSLRKVPWTQALDSIVRASKLAYVQEGNIIRVDTLENLAKEAEAAFKHEQREIDLQARRREADIRLKDQEQESERSRREADIRLKDQEQESERRREEFEAQRRELQPLAEDVVRLKFAHVGIKKIQHINFFTDTITEADERGIEDMIMGAAEGKEGKRVGLLSPRGAVTIDQRTNSLVVRDLPENVARIREFIDKVDRPAQSVLIEARLVEMTRTDARSLGVIWGGLWTPRATNGPILDVRGAPPGGPVSGATPGAATPTTAANFPASLGTLLAGATPFGLGIGWLASNFALDLQIQALEGQRRARILSSPSLMTVDNQPATVASGRKFPIISLTGVQGAQQASITFQDVTTRLQVTPRVVGDGRIFLTIAVKDEVETERINTPFLIAPIIATRQTVTQADILDGGTVVISGLRQEAFQNDERGVPWLSKVPVLGWLFKNDLTETVRRELVVFLTAKLVTSPGQAATPADLMPASPGTPAPPAPPGPSGQAPMTTPGPASSAGLMPNSARAAGSGAPARAIAPEPVSVPAVRPPAPATSAGER